MRVISGTAGSLRLKTPKGSQTRPTSDRVRESLFAVLGDLVAGARVLDLFAGSGALAIEALSRGADMAVIIDSDAHAVACIRENLASTRLEAKAEVHRTTHSRALETCKRKGMEFDVIFLDPPYGHGLEADALKSIARNKTLRPGGMVIVEHTSRQPFAVPDGLPFREVRTLKYGDTAVTFLMED